MKKWQIALLSVILSYPLSGLTMVVVGTLKSPLYSLQHPLQWLLGNSIGAIWFAIAIPLGLGFPISDEGGINRMNAYPYIIPTGLVLFFILCKGWRWFRRSPAE